MKISDILVESKQLNEGPFTQSIGRGFGKVAKGVSNIGKDLKTGFKAGYSGEQPPAAPNAAPVKQPPAAPNAAPVKKKENPTWAGVKQGFSRAFGSGSNYYDTPTPNSGDYGKLSRDGSKIWNNKSKSWEPYDKSTAEPAAAPSNAPQAAGAAPSNAPSNAPTTTPNIDRSVSTPVKNVADFGTIQRSIKTLSQRQKAALVAQLSRKPARRESTQAEIDADRERIMGPNSGESIARTGKVVAESFSLYRKQ
jgi:hypothetical protein